MVGRARNHVRTMTGFIIVVLAGAVLWLFIRRNEIRDRMERLDARLHMLELDVARLTEPEHDARKGDVSPIMAEAPVANVPVVTQTVPLAIPPLLPKPDVAPAVEP